MNIASVAQISALVCLLTSAGSGAGYAQSVRDCQASLDDASARDASILCVVLGVKDGRVTVQAKGSHLFASNVMDAGRPLDEEKQRRVERLLLDTLTQALETAPRISYYALNDDERARNAPEDLIQPIDRRNYETWDGYVQAFVEWAASAPGRLPPDSAIAQVICNLHLENITGLVPLDVGGVDAEGGFLTLRAIDLTPSLGDDSTVWFDTPIGDCQPSGVLLQRAQVADLLSDFVGLPWQTAAMRERLKKYFANRGLNASVDVSSSTVSPRQIRIVESNFITRIIWSKSLDKTPMVVSEFLSVLLSRRDFESYRDGQFAIGDFSATGQPVASQLTLPMPRLQNLLTLQQQQAALDGLSLILTDQIGSSSKLRDLFVQKKDPDAPTTSPESAPAAVTSKPAVQGTAQTATEHDALHAPAVPTAAAPEMRPDPPRQKSRFVGGGLFYRPGQRVKPFLQLQQGNVNLGSVVASASGQFGWNGEPLGSGSGRVDYLWFNQLHHRFSAEYTGGTDFTQQRLIAGALSDERRTGNSARLEFEALGGADASHLVFAAEGQRSTVSLSTSQPELTIVTLSGNAVYTLQDLVGPHPFHLYIEPSVHIGREVTSLVDYSSGGIVANLNQHLFDRVLTTVDITARGEWATALTPVVERPSLGGVETLRGFRTDDLIGTRFWSLQPELWFACSGLFGQSKVASFFENVRIAGFADVGGAYGVAAPLVDGVRWGPGVGVRFFQGPLALKVDWARGIGEGADGPGRGRFYVGVTRAVTF
jgi:hypothetical protein